MNKKIAVIILVVIIIVVLGIAAYRQYRNTGSENTQPSITLIYPNGGKTLNEGSVYTINWKTQNIPATNKVTITIRRVPPPALPEEGQEFDPIIFTDLENTGSKEWKVSYMYPDGNYIIGINAYESLPITNPISDESDATFQIVNLPMAQATYLCSGGKTVQAAFYKGEEYPVEPGEMPIPSGSVKIILSDGRNFNLVKTLSADGGRYANPDESFVFWDKGNTALVLENGVEKDYKECLIAE
jgi:membrane-bound inhibitor of C-type lysozyme